MSARTDEAPDAPFVAVEHIHKAFGDSQVLRGITFSVRRGEVTCIIGPSGSGKSTILRCIAGLLPIDRGAIRVGSHQVHALETEEQLAELRKIVSIVFQQYNLFPHLTALQNIMLAPIHVRKEDRKEAERHALELMRAVRLEGKEGSYPRELSGGQQQRVAIARALAMRPEVILFDEVTAALDPETVREVLQTIQELATRGITCILVTHEMRFARQISDQVIFVDQGATIESATAQEFFDDPRHPRLKAFLSNVL